MNAVACILISVVSFSLGFLIMVLIARGAVYRIRADEIRKHQELLNECAEQTGVWQDVANDLLDAVQEGRLHNKSVAHQMKILRDIIKADTMKPVPDERQDQ